MNSNDNAQEIYVELGALVSTFPNLKALDDRSNIPDETIAWLAELEAIVSRMGIDVGTAEFELKAATTNLIRHKGRGDFAANIRLIALRCLAIARAKAPATARGAFIPTGADFDAFAALNKIIKSATSSILIVDPYLDESIFRNFLVLANENVRIALLGDESGVRSSLEPAARAWISQYGQTRHLAVRIAPSRTLHDRAILIDKGSAWILTQSLKDFAARSPATIQQVDAELAAMKVQAYSSIWTSSRSLVDAG